MLQKGVSVVLEFFWGFRFSARDYYRKRFRLRGLRVLGFRVSNFEGLGGLREW